MTNSNLIYDQLKTIPDPEIPVLNILDLGIVRAVEEDEDQIEVTITPTYSGCPAMNTIEMQIRAGLESTFNKKVIVHTILSPAWTTKWLSEEGKRKLKEYGIAPPQEDSYDKSSLFAEPKQIQCPHCNSTDTYMLSEFGSTACKSLYKCNDCLETFDYFKCH